MSSSQSNKLPDQLMLPVVVCLCREFVHGGRSCMPVKVTLFTGWVHWVLTSIMIIITWHRVENHCAAT
jgi:hypothetical protein